MKIRDPRLIRVAGWMIGEVVRLWTGTVRYRIDPKVVGIHPADPVKARYIYAFWHEALLFPLVFRMPCTALISQHADGELIARACRRLGVKAARGSSTRGGGAGLLGMVGSAEDGHLMITPDGPRGPRRRVQPGIVALASHSGLPIVPVGVGCTAGRRAKSWDRFHMPRPFATATFVAGDEVAVPPGLGKGDLEAYRLAVEERLLRATESAEHWAATLRGRDRRPAPAGPPAPRVSPSPASTPVVAASP